MMPMYFFSVQDTFESGTELMEISAPNFLEAVQALAEWRPGIHILRLEGVCTNPPGRA